MSIRRALRRWSSNTQGNVAIATALCMPLVMGAGGLSMDTVQWVLWKRQLQRSADSAALAGAFAIAQDKNGRAAALADLNQSADVTWTSPPVIENAPTSGAEAGNSRAVRVIVTHTRALPFISFFLAQAPPLRAEATAAVYSSDEFCVLSLEESNTTGIVLQGNATVDLGCGMKTNANAANAVSATGSSMVKSSPVSAVGGINQTNNYAPATVFQPNSIRQPDPFASIAPPEVSPGCSKKLSVGPKATAVVMPGCYKGMDLKGDVTLLPGTYIIDGDAFDLGSQAEVTGSGVTIVLTSANAATDPGSIATLNVNGGANLSLTSPTMGTYKGIVIYQDRRALDQGTNRINGNAALQLEGAIYMPKQELHFSGTAGQNTKCLQIVSKRVTFIGNNKIENQCSGGGKAIKAPLIRLVA